MQMPSYVADFAIKMKRQMVMLATVYTITELCFIFGISRKTYYKYKKDVDLFDSKGLFYNSSAPEHVHNKTPEWIELLVVDFSVEKYWWLSSYRISDLLEAEKRIKLSPSTIQNIWRRCHVPEMRSKRYYAQRSKKKDKKQEGRSYYAQYKGKIERWIETFRSDFLSQFMSFEDNNLVEMQENLCDFVRIYNTIFKHKEIGNIPPCVRMKDAKGKDLLPNLFHFVPQTSLNRKRYIKLLV